jgi:hypothetical protein
MSWEQLTGRELDVLELIADGLSNEGIASRLFVSVKTVEAVCRSLFVKLDLEIERREDNRRVKAAVLYVKSGHRRTLPDDAQLARASDAGIEDLEELVASAPFDTIVTVLEQRALTARAGAWSLLARAAWFAAIREDLPLARRLTEQAGEDCPPNTVAATIVSALRATLDSFVGDRPIDAAALEALARVAASASDSFDRSVFDAVAPVLEIPNWFTFADRLGTAGSIADHLLDRRLGSSEGLASADPTGWNDREAVLCCRAELDVRRGRWQRAIGDLHEVINHRTEGSSDAGYARTLVARIEGGRGNAASALEHLKLARSAQMERGDLSTAWRAEAARGFVFLAQGSIVEAVEALEVLPDFCERSEVRLPSVRLWDADLVEALAAHGRRAEAHAAAERLFAAVVATESAWGTAALLRCRAILDGDLRSSCEGFGESARLFDQLEAPFEAARSRLLGAERSGRTSQRSEQTRRLASSAHGVFQALGARPFVERARLLTL